MSWAQRLKRVIDIDIETCSVCGGSMKAIACIEDPLMIRKTLTHLRGKTPIVEVVRLPKGKAPPQDDFFSKWNPELLDVVSIPMRVELGRHSWSGPGRW